MITIYLSTIIKLLWILLQLGKQICLTNFMCSISVAYGSGEESGSDESEEEEETLPDGTKVKKKKKKSKSFLLSILRNKNLISPWIIEIPASDGSQEVIKQLKDYPLQTIAGCGMGPIFLCRMGRNLYWIVEPSCTQSTVKWVWPFTSWDPSGAGISDIPGWYMLNNHGNVAVTVIRLKGYFSKLSLSCRYDNKNIFKHEDFENPFYFIASCNTFITRFKDSSVNVVLRIEDTTEKLFFRA